MKVYWAEIEYTCHKNNGIMTGVVYAFVKAKDALSAYSHIEKGLAKLDRSSVFYYFIKPYNEVWTNKKHDELYRNLYNKALQTTECVFDTFYDYEEPLKVYWASIEFIFSNKNKHAKGGFTYAFIRSKDAIIAYHMFCKALEDEGLHLRLCDFIKPYDIETLWSNSTQTKHYINLYNKAELTGDCIFDTFFIYEKES